MRGGMPKQTRILAMVGWLSAILIFSGPCLSQGQDAESSEKSKVPEERSELKADAIQTKLKSLQENKELDPALKTRLTDTYNQILESLQSVADANTRKDRYTKQTQDAPETLQKLRQSLAQEATELPLDLSKDASLAQCQQRLSEIENQLSDANKALKDWQDEPRRRSDRRAEIPKQFEANKQQLQALDEQLNAKPPENEAPEETTAKRLLLEAQKGALQVDSAASQAELRLYEAEAELVPVQRDLAARKVSQLESLVKRLRDEVNERRRREAEHQAREASRAAAEAEPALRSIAEMNEELAKRRQILAMNIENTVQNLESIKRRLELLDDQFKKVARRVDIGQRNPSIGLLLRKQRDELPDITAEQHKIQAIQEINSDLSLKLYDDEDTRYDLALTTVNDVLEGLGPNVTDDNRALLENDIRQMLQTQKDLLDAIIVDTNNYLDKLFDLASHERDLITKTQEFAEFCDEHILWIRSAPELNTLKLKDLLAAARWISDADYWRDVWGTLREEWISHSWTNSLLILGWFILLWWRPSLRKMQVGWGEQASRASCRSYLPTVQTVIASWLLALHWPAMTGWLGWHLHHAPSGEFAHAIGKGLVDFSWLYGALEWFRQIIRHKGLAEAHFSWDASSLRTVRHVTRWTMLLGLPLMLIVLVTESQSNEAYKNSIGRLAFLVGCFLLLIPAYRTTRLTKGVFTPAYQSEPGAWWSRLKRFWQLIAVSGPLVLISLAATGFYYTAVQCAERVLHTTLLIISLIVLYCLFLRWLLVAYRKLGMQRLQLRRAAAEASATTTPIQTNTQLEIKLSDINQQTRKLLQLLMGVLFVVGVWWIWAALFPALESLRTLPVWPPTAFYPKSDGEEVLVQITLSQVVLSLVVSMVTYTLTRNLQSLLELTFLNRLSLDPGARYAVATVARYAITATGISLAFNILGFEWSQIQWLVAALGVGLGFGLQEIFANFFSGIVLLFERPIRIGDVVSMGDVVGKVSNIRLRATTITDWDEHELIVPNKEFITNHVINWTLSSTVSRMSINVGVAYGTDPDRVRAILLEIASNHPLALKDPPPNALLDSFGDSTLNLVLRVYMPTLNVYLQLRHELMTQIASRFHQEGIEIAFPQRDVRVQIVDRREVTVPGT